MFYISFRYNKVLIKIYNGKSDISKEKANIILAHYNDEKFIDLINNGLNDTVRGDLKKDLEKVGITYKKKYELGKKCADLFKSILIDISKKSNTKKPNTSKLQKTSSNNKNVSAPQFSIPAQFEICFCCKYWSGNRPESLDPDISIKGKCMAEYNSEVKPYTCKDSCDNFSPDYGAVDQYNRQNFIKSIGSRDMLKFFKK